MQTYVDVCRRIQTWETSQDDIFNSKVSLREQSPDNVGSGVMTGTFSFFTQDPLPLENVHLQSSDGRAVDSNTNGRRKTWGLG